MAMKSLKISVERLLEQEVDEINRSGEEQYVKPFNISEELTYLAGKIDFYEGIQGHESGDIEEEEDEDSKTDKSKDKEDSKHDNEWHWSSVHSKLRIALSEMCVMLDVLQTLNKKKYLILDPIQQSAEPDKQTVQMLEKRKILAKVGNIIAKGAAGLGVKTDKPETIVIDGVEEVEYYTQLMELRQFWRVKKSGNQITGDLSYRTSGSKFWHPGVFEVKKPHNIDENNDDERSLTINISPDVVKTSEITVQLIDENDHFPWISTSIPIQLENNFVNPWEKSMSKAQQHLFNKEIFSQLSNDAFQGSFLGVEVLNSKIKCKILGNVEITISHQVDSPVVSVPEDTYNAETANDLKLLLSSLLYQQHRKNSKFSTPYPSTSNYFWKQSKSSGITNLLHRVYDNIQPSILQEFMKQAEHKVWIHRVNAFLYKQSKTILEPSINFHWNVLKSRLKSVVKITLLTKCLHKSIMTNFMVTIDEDGFHIFSEDITTISLPLDVSSLNHLMQTQIYNHLHSVIKVLCKQHKWSMVNINTGKILLSPSYSVESPITLTSFNRNKTAKFYVGNLNDIKVEVSKDNIDKRQHLHLDSDFEKLNKPFINIPWECIPGSFFVEKCEALLLF